MRTGQAGYRPELDGIRAIAVAAVVLAHAGAPLPGGHLGVDIFFVLSGYLITRHIIGDLAAGRFSLRQFYIRRARRILPALAVVALVSIPVAWVLLPPAAMQQFGQGLVALTFFGSNVLFWLNAGYFAPAAAENPLIHTWSLAVEEQFYLAFPLCMILLWRGARKAIGIVLALVAVVSLVGFAALWQNHPDMVFYLTPFRVWELMAGALVAWVCRHGSTGPRAGGPPGLLLIGLALVGGDHHGAAAWAWNVLAVAGTALLLASAHSGTRTAQILSLPRLRALGLISYSTYLWHQPVFAFARMGQIAPLASAQMAGLILLTLVLAGLTWWLVEQPLRRGTLPRLQIAGGGAIACALAAFGLTAHVTQGLPNLRFAAEQRDLFATALASPERERCHGSVLSFRECVYGQGEPKWAVLGDSHAVEIAYALGDALTAKDTALLHLSASACPPEMGDAPCAKWLKRAVSRLQEEPVHTVLLAWRHAFYLSEGHTKSVAPARYHQAIRDIVDRVQSSGARVIVLAPVPELPRDIGLHIREASGRALPIQTRDAYDARQSGLLGFLKTLPVEVLDPANALCDDKHCYAAPGGEAAYFDDDHLSVAGARRVISPLLEDMQTAGALDR